LPAMILFETQKTRVYRRSRPSVRGFCACCGRDVTLLSPSAAANLLSENAARIYFLMDTNKVHYCGDADGTPLICLVSLSTI